jgi:hypothetical protein
MYGIASTGDVYVAPDWPRSCNDTQGRVPRCAGHDDLARKPRYVPATQGMTASPIDAQQTTP